MPKQEDFKKILIIGPDYKNHRGGIGAVIDAFQQMFPDCKFYCSYNYLGAIGNIFFGVTKIFLFPIYLLLHPSLKIIHIHGASRGSFYRKYWYFIVSKYLFRKKVIYHIHGAEYHIFLNECSKLVKASVKQFIENADAVIVLSDSWKDFFCKNFPFAKIVRIYNPIRENNVPLQDDSNQVPRFLFLGHISERKGCFELIDAAYELKKKGFDFFVDIGGNGKIDELRRKIDEYDLNENIKFHGWLQGEMKRKLLMGCSVFVLPSRNEGLPVSILEAMSYAKPILSTKVGGIPEMVEDCKNGFLIDPIDLGELINKMKKFIENPQIMTQMGIESMRKINTTFSEKIIRKEIGVLYETLLNKD